MFKKKAGTGAPNQPGGQWTVKEVCQWLEQLKMGEYTQHFKKHKIDGIALLNLTSENLQELGVGTLGHRNRLLTEIGALRAKLAQASGQAPPPQNRAQPVPTIGLVARKVDGEVKVFCSKTGLEVKDIAQHQRERQKSIMLKKKLNVAGESNDDEEDMEQDDAPPSRPPPVVRRPMNDNIDDDDNFAPPPSRPPPMGRDLSNAHTQSNWYVPNLQKDAIAEYIEYEAEGTFVVRDSASEAGCYAISYVYRGEVLHKLIEPVGRKYRIRASALQFDSLTEVIEHFARDGGSDLKCALSFPRDIYDVRAYREERLAAKQQSGGAALGATPDEKRFHREWQQKTARGRPSWDCLHLNRDQALALLNNKSEGAFVIRPSDKAFAAISLVKRDGSQFHQHIDALPSGLQLKKSTVVVGDLFEFVKHYSSSYQTDLPSVLRA